MRPELLFVPTPAVQRSCLRPKRVADEPNSQLGEACTRCRAPPGIGDKTRRRPCTGPSLARSRTFKPPGSLKTTSLAIKTRKDRLGVRRLTSTADRCYQRRHDRL